MPGVLTAAAGKGMLGCCCFGVCQGHLVGCGPARGLGPRPPPPRRRRRKHKQHWGARAGTRRATDRSQSHARAHSRGPQRTHVGLGFVGAAARRVWVHAPSRGSPRGNDPSAGSPTETLLRLHLPLNDKVYLTFHGRAATRTIPATIREVHRTIQSVGATGGVYKGQGRNQCKLMTCAY